jgi:hypothetical protein
MGVLLDGVKSIRVFEAEEILVELYNKAWNGKGLRRSVHTLIPVKKSEIEGVLFGGLYTYKKGKSDERLNENFRKLSDFLKHNNSQTFRLTQAVIDRAKFEQTRFDGIDKAIEALAMGRLTDRQLLEKFYAGLLLDLDLRKKEWEEWTALKEKVKTLESRWPNERGVKK